MKRHILLFCFLLAIGANSFSTTKAQVDVNDSLALVDLYNSTNGNNWDYNLNWLTKKPVSTWYGIIVTGTRVTSINLGGNELSGSIPETIGNLANLGYLNLAANQLSGTIPSSMGNLVNLNIVNLARNKITGNIPATIGNLSKLTYLYLNHNRLNGSIPSSIGNMVELFYLDFSHNNLKGALPFSMGNLVNLRYLFLSNNQLTGGIPGSFLKLKSLYSVNLSRNYLTQRNNTDFPMFGRRDGYVDVSYNRSTFNGLEFLSQNVRRPTYAPQAIIPLHQHGNALSVFAGGTLSNNTYTWFIVGETGSTTITGDSTYTPSQSGKYYVQVTNAIATQLTLHSDTVDYVANAVLARKAVISSSFPAMMKTFSAYPNPAKDKITIQGKGTAIFTLTNLQGKMIITKVIEHVGTMDVTTVPSGVYYLTNTITGRTQKIVVNK